VARHLHARSVCPRRSRPPRAGRHAGPHLEHEFPSLGRRPRRPAGASPPRSPAGALLRDRRREAGSRALRGGSRPCRRAGGGCAVCRRQTRARRGGPEPRHRRFRRGGPGGPRGRASTAGLFVTGDREALRRRPVASKVIRRESRSTPSSPSRKPLFLSLLSTLLSTRAAGVPPRAPRPPRRGCRQARGSPRRESPAARRRGA
jgi:hypothetical protein